MDDKSVCTEENTIEELISTLEKEIQAVIDWFKSNQIIAHPNKFQAITVKRNNEIKDSYPVYNLLRKWKRYIDDT